MNFLRKPLVSCNGAFEYRPWKWKTATFGTFSFHCYIHVVYFFFMGISLFIQKWSIGGCVSCTTFSFMVDFLLLYSFVNTIYDFSEGLFVIN